MNRVIIAALHCSSKAYAAILALAVRILNGIYVNTTEYATPPMTKAEFEPLYTDARDKQALVGQFGHSAKLARDASFVPLFAAISTTLLPYVNKLYRGNAPMLVLSGFDTALEPTEHDVPSTPIISRIERGTQKGTAKIFLARLTGRYEKTEFFVYMADNEDFSNYRNVLVESNSHKLVIPNLTKGKEVEFYICRKNARGFSAESGRVKFMPE